MGWKNTPHLCQVRHRCIFTSYLSKLGNTLVSKFYMWKPLYFICHDCPELQLMEQQLTKKERPLNYTQIVFWNDDAKKGCEFLEVSERHYHHYSCTAIKALLTQVWHCGERHNAKEGIQLTDPACLAKTSKTTHPCPPIKLEHLNWN